MALPEKQLYTLAEVAARWGCTVDDILDFALQASDDDETVSLLSINALVPILTTRWVPDDRPKDGRYAFHLVEIPVESIPDLMLNESAIVWDGYLADEGGRRHRVDLHDREDGNPYTVSRRDLRIVKEDRDRFEVAHKIIGAADVNGEVSLRAETTYLNIIGALLTLMLGKSPGGKPYSVFDTQAAIISAMLVHYEGKAGIAARTLEAKFAAAKRSLTAT